VLLAELRQAAAVTVQAHTAGMASTQTASVEAEVRGAMERVIISHNMTCAAVSSQFTAKSSTISPPAPTRLLLADVGAETAMGWA